MGSDAFEVLLLFAESVGATSYADMRMQARTNLEADARARAARAAWYWPEASEVLSSLSHGVALTLVAPPDDPVEHALRLTRRAAEVGRALRARAYVWEATGLAHDASTFEDQASDATRDDLPLYLWLGFESEGAEDGTISVWTRGMDRFSRLEVEVERSRREIDAILEVVTDVALVSLTSREPIEDGETVEVTRGKVRLRRLPSLRNDGSHALRVRLP